MRYQRVFVESVAHVLPPHVLRSSDFEARIAGTMQRLGYPEGTLEKLTGVKERRWWDRDIALADAAAAAGRKALEQAGVAPSEVQAVVNGSVSRDYLEPATATLVAGQLRIGHSSKNFDVTNACLGFLDGMVAVANLIELGQIDVGLVVAAEKTREGQERTLDRLNRADVDSDAFRANFASLTLGSGAVAAVLVSEKRARAGHRLLGGGWRAATEYNHLCVASHLEMRADSHGLLVHGVDTAVETWPLAAAELGWATPDDVDVVVFHQVGLTHFNHTFHRLEIPLDKALVTFPYLGNTGPVAVPITWSVGVAQGGITAGQTVALFGVGSGLGSAVLGVQW